MVCMGTKTTGGPWVNTLGRWRSARRTGNDGLELGNTGRGLGRYSKVGNKSPQGLNQRDSVSMSMVCTGEG